MHPYFSRLQVRPEVQEFFKPNYTVDRLGNLVFPYGEPFEHFGFAFHKVPASEHLWIAGNTNYSQVRQVIICSSAMEAISWLNKNYHSFPITDNLLFLATGAGVQTKHILWIKVHLPGKEFYMVFGRDMLGRIADVKTAAGLRGWPLEIYHEGDNIVVSFRSRIFVFNQEKFSLNSFEKAAGYRFHITAYKPKGFDSFFDELKANAGFTF